MSYHPVLVAYILFVRYRHYSSHILHNPKLIQINKQNSSQDTIVAGSWHRYFCGLIHLCIRQGWCADSTMFVLPPIWEHLCRSLSVTYRLFLAQCTCPYFLHVTNHLPHVSMFTYQQSLRLVGQAISMAFVAGELRCIILPPRYQSTVQLVQGTKYIVEDNTTAAPH